MSEAEMKTEEADWTKENLQKLLASMKANIPKCDRMKAFSRGMKTMDWNKVSFPPFSPEACLAHWQLILEKMRTVRTLTELIDEAEADAEMSDPKPNTEARSVEKSQIATEEYQKEMAMFRKKEHCRACVSKHTTKVRDGYILVRGATAQESRDVGLPPRPAVNGYSLFCKEKKASMPGIHIKNYVSGMAQEWRDLTEEQRNEYSTRCRELREQYPVKLNKYLSTLDEDEQQRILDENGLKAPKVRQRVRRKTGKTFPGEPKMPCRKSQLIFFQEQLGQLKEKIPKPRDRFSMVSHMWNKLHRRERKLYAEKVHQNDLKYSAELQKWFRTLTAAKQKDYLISNRSKRKFLGLKQTNTQDKKVKLGQTSDSEDEVLDDSSSEEEENGWDLDEEEEEEENDDVTFDMY